MLFDMSVTLGPTFSNSFSQISALNPHESALEQLCINLFAMFLRPIWFKTEEYWAASLSCLPLFVLEADKIEFYLIIVLRRVTWVSVY